MIKPLAVTFMKIDRQQKLTALTQVSFYELLREDDLSFILCSCECVSLKAGELIFFDQSFKEGKYIVLNGSVKTYKKHRHIAFRSVGDYLGKYPCWIATLALQVSELLPKQYDWKSIELYLINS